ncbi:SO_0444 family Cu/Zn efflux transporter [Candidatus Sumerlaeota bacterium]|nr:SO_0444 family Cu/Zn efflux transporter [Candidatus Sumerlaeota bacterium]
MAVWFHVKGIALEIWTLWFDMGIYLVFGFAVAAILSRLLRKETIARHLGADSVGSVAKASLFGVPLPLCSCGVIPVALSLFRRGASRGATTSFLISTPQTGVDSIVVTWAFLGPVFAVVRPVAAFLNGLLGGVLVTWFGERAPTSGPQAIEPDSRAASTATDAPASERVTLMEHIRRAAYYGCVEFPAEIVNWLVIGIVLAALIGHFLPDDVLERHLGHGLLSMAAMAVVGVPLYICATASVPLVAVLMTKGLGAGAALVFLITGPATNTAGLVPIARSIGKRSAVLYVASIVACAFLFGWLLEAYALTHSLAVPSTMLHRHSDGGWLRVLGGVGLAVMAIGGMLRNFGLSRRARPSVESGAASGPLETIVLDVEGMTCANCVRHVRQALENAPGVASVAVGLREGKATVAGNGLSRPAILAAVDEAGYRARVSEE